MTFFFFNDTATTEIYTLSLHDALPISGPGPSPPGWTRRAPPGRSATRPAGGRPARAPCPGRRRTPARDRKEHTSELQSRQYLVCRLLLEKKNNHQIYYYQCNYYNAQAA